MPDIGMSQKISGECGFETADDVHAARATAACAGLQLKLVSLVQSLDCSESAQERSAARTRLKVAIEAAREAVKALRMVESLPGPKQQIIAGHRRDTEEIVFALALINDQSELGPSHHAFAVEISSASERTRAACNATLTRACASLTTPNEHCEAHAPSHDQSHAPA